MKKPKILFTGCTSKQTNDDAWKRARVKRIDDSSIICNSLRKQGYEVVRRKVEVGDDLSEFDMVIVGMGIFGSMNYSGHILSTFYTITQFPKNRVMTMYEDWRIDQNINSYKGHIVEETMDKILAKRWSTGKEFYGGAIKVQEDPALKDDILEAIQMVLDGEFVSFVPAFDWGDKQVVRDIIKSEVIFNFDLSPYVKENWNLDLENPVPFEEKEKAYMLASLADHSRWVKKQEYINKWPVDYYGTASLKAPKLKDETEVYDYTGNYIGILAPEYPLIDGSGWGRSRFWYAAYQKSIILGSKGDMKALGIPHRDIEGMSDDELKAYAEIQSKAIIEPLWSKETFDNKMVEYVNFIMNQ